MSKEQNKFGHLIDEATKTPRTQAAIKTYGDYIRSEDAVSIEFAEQLETELAEARAEIENKQYTITCASEENQQLKGQLADARAEIERIDHHRRAGWTEIKRKDKLIEQMREALNWYKEQVSNCNRNGDIGETARDRLAKDVGKRAKAALSAAERGEGL